MSYMPPVEFSVATMASDATLSTYVMIPISYRKVLLEIPTMTSGCNVYIQGCQTASGTFRRIRVPTTAVTGAVPGAWNVDSSITNCWAEIPNAMKYMKVELSTAMTATAAKFTFVCID